MSANSVPPGTPRPSTPPTTPRPPNPPPPPGPRPPRGTAQYGRQEQAIAAADSGGIWQRWLYGLRLLADAEKIAPAGGLKHGVAEALIAEAAKRGVTLSAREIQWRLQCARAYPTEAQMRNAVTRFVAWRDVIQAGFPTIERPEGEPDADYRTAKEIRHDRARDAALAAAERASAQLELFPAAHLEPARSTLADLEAYAVEQAEMTARFAKRDAERRAHLDELIAAAGGDMDMLWQDAEDRLAALAALDSDAIDEDEQRPAVAPAGR